MAKHQPDKKTIPSPTQTPTTPPVSDATALDAVWVELNNLKQKVKSLTDDVNGFADQLGPVPTGYAAIIMDADSRIYPVRVKDVDLNGLVSKSEAIAAAHEWIISHNMSGSYRAGVLEIF